MAQAVSCVPHIHAESARQAIERKFDQVVALSGRAMPTVKDYLGDLVDIENRSLLGGDG